MRPDFPSRYIAALLLGALFSAACMAAELPANPGLHRLADGRPDLNGTWDNGSGVDFLSPMTLPDGSVCLRGCEKVAGAKPIGTALRQPRQTRPQYRPEFAAKVADLEKRQVAMDPVLRCRAPGLPRIGPPDKIVQVKGELVFLYDDVSGAFFRIVPTDGRPHRADADESYLGDSIGWWEGDTLVVEAVNFNEDTWLTDDGAFHTAELRVKEYFVPRGDVIEYRAVAEDPKVLAQPWEVRRIMTRTGTELLEPVPCIEQDLQHMQDDSHHDNPR